MFRAAARVLTLSASAKPAGPIGLLGAPLTKLLDIPEDFVPRVCCKAQSLSASIRSFTSSSATARTQAPEGASAPVLKKRNLVRAVSAADSANLTVAAKPAAQKQPKRRVSPTGIDPAKVQATYDMLVKFDLNDRQARAVISGLEPNFFDRFELTTDLEAKLSFIRDIGMGAPDIARALHLFPKLLHLDPALLAKRAASLQSTLALSKEQLARIITFNPSALGATESSIQDKVAYLQGEMGMSLADVAKIVNIFPSFINYNLDTNVKSRIAFLSDVVGLAPDDVKRVLASFPQIFGLNTQNLEAKWSLLCHFLCTVNGYSKASAQYVVQCHIRALSYSISTRVLPRLAYLQLLGRAVIVSPIGARSKKRSTSEQTPSVVAEEAKQRQLQVRGAATEQQEDAEEESEDEETEEHGLKGSSPNSQPKGPLTLGINRVLALSNQRFMCYVPPSLMALEPKVAYLVPGEATDANDLADRLAKFFDLWLATCNEMSQAVFKMDSEVTTTTLREIYFDVPRVKALASERQRTHSRNPAQLARVADAISTITRSKD